MVRDIDLLLNADTNDFVFDEHPMTMHTQLKGRQRFPNYLTMLFKAFPNIIKSARKINAEGIRIWTERTMIGTHQGEFCGIAPTRRKIKIHGASVFEIRDSNVASERLYWDMRDVPRPSGKQNDLLTMVR